MKEIDNAYRFELVVKRDIKDNDGNVIGQKSVSKKFKDGNQMYWWAKQQTSWKFEAKQEKNQKVKKDV